MISFSFLTFAYFGSSLLLLTNSEPSQAQLELYSADLETSENYSSHRYSRQTTTACAKRQYACKNGQCIKSTAICDGKKDCEDGSDETRELCGTFRCPGYTFRCAYGACVDGSAKCNGVKECVDGSDEKETDCPPVIVDEKINQPTATCSPEEFKCKNGICIDRYSVCDGTLDCADGSDETATECDVIKCPANTFQCSYGACVPGDSRCDGVKQCADGSDESSLTCSTRRVTPSTETTTTSTRRPIVTQRPTPTSPTSRPVTTTEKVQEGGCQIPAAAPGRNHKVHCSEGDTGSVCRARAGDFVPPFTTISVGCDAGYVYKDDRGNMSYCVLGTWQPFVAECLKTCKKLKPVNVDLTCYYRGSLTDCDGPMRPQTKVRPTCLPAYRPQTIPTYREIECNEDGEWDDILFKCVPECGVPFNNPETLIFGGVPAKYGDSPWHVAIYDITTRVLICGGTIITPNLVVSAAHCFYSEVSKSRRKETDYEIVVSKVTRDYTILDNGQTRSYKIRTIHYPPKGYYGRQTNHVSDIAILEVIKIVLSPEVRPACVDWIRRERFNPPLGTPGKVVGWGVDSSGDLNGSPTLLAAELPYVSYERCLQIAPEDFKQYITEDKFCAGNTTGPGVRQGDSGGGLLFRYQGLYYVFGVVSIKPTSVETSLAAFTDVSEHIEWLNQVRADVDRRLILEDTTLQLKVGR